MAGETQGEVPPMGSTVDCPPADGLPMFKEDDTEKGCKDSGLV
jgi:hypothetical protein